eukprot:m.117008 g.117008  ORF g.117008 m.117008 type:complete len:101 (+) comp9315_c5_seq1:38-340(+)
MDPNKIAILKCTEQLFDLRKTAAAPSKNYHQLVVNAKGVIFRTWKIDPPHGVHHADLDGSAAETVVSINDFNGGELHEQIENIFGKETLKSAIEFAKDKQ